MASSWKDGLIELYCDHCNVAPLFVLRQGIRQQLRTRIREIATTTAEDSLQRKQNYVGALRKLPIAIATSDANEQHYEVPSDFFKACLGPQLKYSCCLYPTGSETLAEAEEAMLQSYIEKAGLTDSGSILDLGCAGWGSLSLFLAKTFPNSQITALSNSASQKVYIDGQASTRNLTNLNVVTGDIKDFDDFEADSFDHVCSIEMFEHMKNYELLLQKIAKWLKPKGILFVHIFCHRTTPYHMEEGWMTKHFFTGGTFASSDLFLYFQDSLKLDRMWLINGSHYSRTCEDWLKSHYKNRTKILDTLGKIYGKESAQLWFNRWTVFFIACSELFAFNGGEEWMVAHYRFMK